MSRAPDALGAMPRSDGRRSDGLGLDHTTHLTLYALAKLDRQHRGLHWTAAELAGYVNLEKPPMPEDTRSVAMRLLALERHRFIEAKPHARPKAVRITDDGQEFLFDLLVGPVSRDEKRA